MSRVALVTGSNRGIGFAIVKELCSKFDGVVYLTARDIDRGKSAIRRLEQNGLKALFHQLDITDEKSIVALRNHLVRKHEGLDVLVNNAAIAYEYVSPPSTETLDVKAVKTLNTNFFGTMKFCDFIFPILRPGARVVNVSSSAGLLRRLRGKELQEKFANPKLTREELVDLMNSFIKCAKEGTVEENGWPLNTYSVSKIGLNALTQIQQREFNEDVRQDLVVNSVHPGYTATDMTSFMGTNTPEEGAVAPVYAALLPPNVVIPKGNFIWSDIHVVDWVNGSRLRRNELSL